MKLEFTSASYFLVISVADILPLSGSASRRGVRLGDPLSIGLPDVNHFPQMITFFRTGTLTRLRNYDHNLHGARPFCVHDICWRVFDLHRYTNGFPIKVHFPKVLLRQSRQFSGSSAVSHQKISDFGWAERHDYGRIQRRVLYFKRLVEYGVDVMKSACWLHQFIFPVQTYDHGL